ncbi:Aldo/keto reductase [Pustulibacterium marinum]|uniref:Aldo/keto reductase n=1 Tax=Pustulibacterium marinum TaxID=1224947 RepID=A0A1I7IQ16_9FLAO|nr:aldo/keto reductase [Pustulibacterium marinum]SFU74987.1 Aldo/keto reductase [Pustulibacterium marinum]
MNISDISEKTTLHNNIQMPYLGLGVYKSKDGQEVEKAIASAFDNGYRLIDTASYYNNEEGVGNAIKNSSIPREEIFVTTKVWNDDHGYENTLKAFEISLNKLQLDYIDLYMIHWPMPDLYIETWKAMETLYKTGKVKAIGVCNCMPHHIETLVKECSIKPMVLQNEFHPRLVQEDILDFCKLHNIQMQAWSPLMRGRILDNETLQEIGKKYNKSTAQIILRWNLQKGICTIPKSVHENRIIENASVFDFELTPLEINTINRLDTNERTGAHPDHFIEHFKQKEAKSKS